MSCAAPGRCGLHRFFTSSLFKGRTIGLLGGSFNPAHEGHLHISLIALKSLKLDEVWWMVSPQNPLKPKADMADFTARMASAQYLAARHPKIRVTAIEKYLDTRYTHATLQTLQKRMPQTRFIWLMGADNLANFHHWQEWKEIAASTPIAVFDRAPFSHAALHSRAAIALRRYHLPHEKAITLRQITPPAICYLAIRKHPLSASYLRKTLGKSAFFRHNQK